MNKMKYWNSSFVLFGLILGIAGEGNAIASPESPVNRVNAESSFQLAQVNNLGRQGECRAAKRETPIYRENSIRTVTGIYLNENDTVQLLENNRRGKRLIAVRDMRRNVIGYVETSELKLCPPTPLAVNNTLPSAVPYGLTQPQSVVYTPLPQIQPISPSQQVPLFPPVGQYGTPPTQTIVYSPLNLTQPVQSLNPRPQQEPFFPSVSRCTIATDTNLYEAPGFDSTKKEFLEVGINIEVDRQRRSTVDNRQWIYASTAFGESGWVSADMVGCL